MTYKINEEITDEFRVSNSTGSPVLGITGSDFTYEIYKDQVLTAITGSFNEINNGYYFFSFTPTLSGLYTYIFKHSTYQPQGWYNHALVRDTSIDDIQTTVSRILGLTQENFYLHDLTYNPQQLLTSGSITIHTDAASVGTGSNILAEYAITGSYNAYNLLLEYKVVKI